jgi:hypothetical protein
MQYMVKTIPIPRSTPYLRTLLAYVDFSRKLRGAEDLIMQIRGTLTQVEKFLLAEIHNPDGAIANQNLAPGLRINIPTVGF